MSEVGRYKAAVAHLSSKGASLFLYILPKFAKVAFIMNAALWCAFLGLTTVACKFMCLLFCLLCQNETCGNIDLTLKNAASTL
ncbi:hypothetical protein V5799_023376 [Amblyomma americanum]|uniref:Uncharacterized protein n=1 Tax=Amblyomma americanum TaxID=6943 RepID=A0AAQ4FJG4_AMBAM